MLKLQEMYNKRVYRLKKAKKKRGKDAEPAASGPVYAKFGRIHDLVFTPKGDCVVGVLVKRPDVAGMVKRDDVFVPLDSLIGVEGGYRVREGEATTDDAARKRLGIDWDRCMRWNGMDAKTRSGKPIGYVNDVAFDEHSGKVATFFVGDGGISQSLVGSFEVPASMVLGYQHGCMVLADEAAHLELNGGAAAAAGVGYAKAKASGKRAAAKAGAATAEAVDKGSHALGRGLGKAKRAIEEAMADDEDEEEVTAPEPVPARDVRVSDPEVAGELHRGESETKPTPTTYVATTKTKAQGTGKPASAKAKSAAKPAKAASKEDKAAANARKVGRQLKKTRGMWGSFMDEFNKASK